MPSNTVLTFIAGNNVTIVADPVGQSLTFSTTAAVYPLANTTANGLMSFVAQAFAGVKTFTANTEFSGYVNIASTLQVAGAVTLASTLSANGTIGVNNQVLTSNNGAAFWAPVRPVRGWTGLIQWGDQYFNTTQIPQQGGYGFSLVSMTQNWGGGLQSFKDNQGYWANLACLVGGSPTYAEFQTGGDTGPWWARCDMNPYCRWTIRTGPVVSNTRILVLLSDHNPWLGGSDGYIGDDLHYLSGIGLVYSTVRGDTGWRTWFSNGSVQTLGAVFAPVLASTNYSLELDVHGGICTARANSVAAATFTVPASILTTPLASQLWLRNPDDSVALSLLVKQMYAERD
jgi:hypothetical protein